MTIPDSANHSSTGYSFPYSHMMGSRPPWSPALPAPLLALVDVTKVYPPHFYALREVDLTLRSGEIVTLLGANGAGKSTLAKILTGAETPTSGALRWDGRDLEIASPAAAKRLGIGIVFQELNLLPNLTAAENVVLGNFQGSALRPFSATAAERVYKRYSELVPDAPNPDALLRSLGVGQRQKVAIIRALAQQPRLLILDEGTSSWNLTERQEFQEVLKRLAHDGNLAALYITHFIDDAINVGDRVVVLRDGAKVYEAETDARISHAEIIHAISGELPSTLPARSPQCQCKPHARQGHTVPVLNVEGLATASVGPLHLAVSAGECVGFYGYPGCGATEALEAIAGLIPHRGTVRWNNIRLKRNATHRLRHGVILCSGDRPRQLISSWPLYLNVGLPRLFKRSMFLPVPMREFVCTADALVRGFGVKGDVWTRLAALSGGNQQKVILGSALELDRPLLVLGDDLTRGIDAVARLEIYRIMKTTLSEDVAFILWSTDPSEIRELCSRVYIFAHGRIVNELVGEGIKTDRLEYLARTRAGQSRVA